MTALVDGTGRKMYVLVRGPGPVMIIEWADLHVSDWLTAQGVVQVLRVMLEARVKQ
jgi:hypothetical protein